MSPVLPTPRGPLSELLCRRLGTKPGRIPLVLDDDDESSVTDDDLQLALHICFALHYDGFQEVDDSWEWEPSLAHVRAFLETRFLSDLLATLPGDVLPGGGGRSPLESVRRLIDAGTGPSLSQFMLDRGTLDHFREFVIHRSIYQRKEADAHTWAIPRLRGRAKSAIVTLQSDEYGNGVSGRSHAELFANTMLALELDPAPGAYVDQVPGVTLATDNLVTLLGRHRRWRGALVGHLAVFEMTSVTPMSRYAAALRQMCVSEVGAEFYDAHVQADVVHARIAGDELIGGLVESDPHAAGDILFGAASLLAVESCFSRHLLGRWEAGHTSLRASGSTRWPVGVEPVPDPDPEPVRTPLAQGRPLDRLSQCPG